MRHLRRNNQKVREWVSMKYLQGVCLPCAQLADAQGSLWGNEKFQKLWK